MDLNLPPSSASRKPLEASSDGANAVGVGVGWLKLQSSAWEGCVSNLFQKHSPSNRKQVGFSRINPGFSVCTDDLLDDTDFILQVVSASSSCEHKGK